MDKTVQIKGNQQNQASDLQNISPMIHAKINAITNAFDRAEKYESKITGPVVRSYSEPVWRAHEEGWKTLKSITLNKIAESTKMSNAPDKIKELHEDVCGEDGKIARIKALQNYQKKLLEDGETASVSQQVFVNLSLCPSGVNKGRLEVSKEKYKIYNITERAGADFADAYTHLTALFPTTEMDGGSVVGDFTHKYAEGLIETNTQNQKEYTRHIMLAAKNDEGKVIAVGLGVFIAGQETNEFYLSHIAVLPDYRKSDVASLIQTSMITECNKYAEDAEKKFAEKKIKVSYPADKNNNKLMYAVIEIDFPSLQPSEIPDTWGRLIYHGKNGAAIVPLKFMQYRQPDTTYSGEKWNPLPLFLSIIPIGEMANGERRPVTASTANDLLRMLENSFISLGMFEAGIEADFKAATGSLQRLLSTNPNKKLSLIDLPHNADEVADFVYKVGDLKRIYEKHYKGVTLPEGSGIGRLSPEDALKYFVIRHRIQEPSPGAV